MLSISKGNSILFYNLQPSEEKEQCLLPQEVTAFEIQLFWSNQLISDVDDSLNHLVQKQERKKGVTGSLAVVGCKKKFLGLVLE